MNATDSASAEPAEEATAAAADYPECPEHHKRSDGCTEHGRLKRRQVIIFLKDIWVYSQCSVYMYIAV